MNPTVESTNWAGGAIVSPPSQDTIEVVVGCKFCPKLFPPFSAQARQFKTRPLYLALSMATTKKVKLTLRSSAAFVVPAAGAPGTSVAIWAGIDGIAPNSPLIQGGIFVDVSSSGAISYSSWSEWVPDFPVFYDQTVPIQADDSQYSALSSELTF